MSQSAAMMAGEARPMTLAELAEERHALREQKRALEREAKELGKMLEDNEFQILEAMDAAGLSNARVGKLSIAVSEQVVPNVEDWDGFYGYIKEHDAMHLLQRRASAGAYKEVLESGETIPGVNPFVKRSINLRSGT